MRRVCCRSSRSASRPSRSTMRSASPTGCGACASPAASNRRATRSASRTAASGRATACMRRSGGRCGTRRSNSPNRARRRVSLAPFLQPRLEPEIVFGFARAPRAGMSDAELASTIDWVAHGFEIVHTHFADWRFLLADCFADFALHGRLIVGKKVPIGAFADPARELAALHVVLHRDGQVIDQGDATVVLDGPLTALRIWIDAMAAQPQHWPIRAWRRRHHGHDHGCCADAAWAAIPHQLERPAPVGTRAEHPSLRRCRSTRIVGSAQTRRRTLQERWQSGRMRQTRNLVYGFTVTWVRIPPSPPYRPM